jgi:DNA-binding protein HU-beta
LLAKKRALRAKRKKPGYRPSTATQARRKAARKTYKSPPRASTAVATRKPIKSAAKSAAAKKATATRKRNLAAKKKANELRAKKAAATRRRNLRKTTTTRKMRKTSAAAKTARRRKSTVAKTKRRRGKLTKAQRSRIAKKGWARRRRLGNTKAIKTWRSKRHAHRKSLKRTFKSRKWRRTSRVPKSLKRARKSILFNRAHGTSGAGAFMRRYKMRSNFGGGILDALKKAAPVAISMYGLRMISRKAVPMIPGLGGLGKHAGPLGSLLMLVGASFATKKVKRLMKYRQEILLGAGLNFLDVILSAYAPEPIRGFLAIGSDENIYDSALGEYMQTGEYVDQGGYESEMGDYLQVGAEEELGAFEEMGLMQELGEENIGTGIGTQAHSMVSAVQRRAMTAPVPSRSFVRQVPQVGAGYDSMPNLYTGIFAGGLK